MPAVPVYKPSVSPAATPGSSYQRISAGAESFGGIEARAEQNLGQAEQGLGRSVEQFAGVLEQHANKMQDRLNEADGNDLNVKWTIERSNLATEYSLKQGRDALDALPQYQKDQEELRQKYLGMAGNAEVKRVFDNDSKRQFGYTISEGARHAATQMRSYENQTADAVVQTSIRNGAGARTKAELDDALTVADRAARNKPDMKGLGPEVQELAALTASSKILAAHIDSIAMNDPVLARQIYEENKGKIDGITQNAIEKHLQQQDTSVGTRLLAHDLAEGKIKGVPALTPDSGPGWLTAAQTKAREVAKEKAPTNPNFEDTLLTRVQSEYNLVRKGRIEADAATRNTIASAILGTETGKPITSIDDILNNPKLNEQWLALGERQPERQKQMLNWIKKNAGEDVPMTPERFNLITQMRGMAVSDKKSFAEVDIGNLDIPRVDKRKLLDQQTKINQVGQDEIRLNQVMSYVRPLLSDAGVVKGAPESRESARYNQFLGSFSDQIQAFERENKRLPSEDEAKKMAAGLLRYEDPKAWVFKGERLFERGVPSDIRTQIIEQYKAKFSVEPSDEDIQRFYTRSLLKK